ncbi:MULTISPECIES: hypothetical protein [Prochlorococcus]|uniref:hypothetical protein n=1 Tax=Prochlorococcus TaxID=1218 RepID=UPI0002F6CD6E|nr:MULTISPECIES: hypothetical protein [Prochlorococcus]KGG14292.1 hypothetical protein EV04_0144 [Prochlorococcus marinus str. LG]KGG22135.1 hypothetical protein EV08_0310 [Prochlorococcus marinus str. SS2]KGG24547.1 hypothetical protein EV09_0178 [Prochlorococcus marinus str. SS35]KGG33442.1 hypothetical protein EV10_0650 [Prochlorococcus marinus str. SS51]KGG37358.1 hypothetical protein EV11_0233 [Prochlorococcus sp. SS52]
MAGSVFSEPASVFKAEVKLVSAVTIDGEMIWLVTATITQAKKIEKLMKISFTEICNSSELILAEDLLLRYFLLFETNKNQMIFAESVEC